MQKTFAHYIDEYGLIIHRYEDGTIDGGDSLNRNAHFEFLVLLKNNIKSNHLDYLQKDFLSKLKMFEFSNGDYLRYPNQKWAYVKTSFFALLKENIIWVYDLLKGNKPPHDQVKWATSRDQKFPVMITLASLGLKNELKKIAIKQIKRLGRYQNLDWSIFKELAVYERCFKLGILGKAFLYIGDCSCFWYSVFNILRTNRRGLEVGDWLNHTQYLLLTTIKSPTFLSRWSIRLCLKYGNSYGEKSIFHYAIKAYFKPHHAPPLDVWYCEEIDKHFYGI